MWWTGSDMPRFLWDVGPFFLFFFFFMSGTFKVGRSQSLGAKSRGWARVLRYGEQGQGARGGGGVMGHRKAHRPRRPSDRSDLMQRAEGRTGDRPGPRKEPAARRNVTWNPPPPIDVLTPRPWKIVLGFFNCGCFWVPSLWQLLRPCGGAPGQFVASVPVCCGERCSFKLSCAIATKVHRRVDDVQLN